MMDKTCFDAYDEGKKDGEQAGFAWAIKEFGRPDGAFDVAKMRAWMGSNEKELRETNSNIQKLEKARAALDRLLKVADGSTCDPFINCDTVASMRGKIRSEFLAGQPKPNETAMLSKFKTSMWFDFRKMQIKSDGDMAAFGKEIIEAGLAKLPFDTCVFSFPHLSPTGVKVSANYLLQQLDRKIVVYGGFFFGSGKPIGYCAPDGVEPREPVYYALAVLASRQTVKTPRALTGKGSPSSSRPSDSYVEVTVSWRERSDFTSVGTHASPRLHWRRGHIRHLSDRTTWVRPTLVGGDEGGTVLHDYRVKS
jgi:hypothetical protein